MLASGKIAATGQPIALILMRASDALASPRKGLCAVLFGAWLLVSAWSICGDTGPWSNLYGVSATFPMLLRS
jgi:hypothetical protein